MKLARRSRPSTPTSSSIAAPPPRPTSGPSWTWPGSGCRLSSGSRWSLRSGSSASDAHPDGDSLAAPRAGGTRRHGGALAAHHGPAGAAPPPPAPGAGGGRGRGGAGGGGPPPPGGPPAPRAPPVVPAAVRWLLPSPRFAVAVVEVQGTSRLSPAEVREAAAISPGENLFRLNSEEVVARLRQLGPVKRAEVIRSFPNRVTLVVEERVPFTLAQAGRLYWLDEDGVSLGPEPRAVTPRLPVITGIRPEETRSGGAAAEDARAAVSLIRSMLRTGSPLTREISEIHMSGADGPVLYTVDGIEVRLGTTDWEDRLGRLEGVLTQIRSLGGARGDVGLGF